uniref:Uncharacterized protein n=1 Tax=Pseudomonas phage HRDY3 TaxID=3236930 RepID=A0AB39CEP3_9VIRU
MPTLRVRYKHSLAAQYLTEGEVYKIFWNPNARRIPFDTYFTNMESGSGTYVRTALVEKALKNGGLEIIRGAEGNTV